MSSSSSGIWSWKADESDNFDEWEFPVLKFIHVLEVPDCFYLSSVSVYPHYNGRKYRKFDDQWLTVFCICVLNGQWVGSLLLLLLWGHHVYSPIAVNVNTVDGVHEVLWAICLSTRLISRLHFQEFELGFLDHPSYSMKSSIDSDPVALQRCYLFGRV